jgi:hypothetical protein
MLTLSKEEARKLLQLLRNSSRNQTVGESWCEALTAVEYLRLWNKFCGKLEFSLPENCYSEEYIKRRDSKIEFSTEKEPPLIEPEFDENGHPVWPS